MTGLRTLLINLGVAGRLLVFFWSRRLQWLIPLVAVLLVFGLVFALAATPVIGPFIYTLF